MEASPAAENWVLLKVDDIHAVRQIEPGQQRIFISVGLLIDQSAQEFFKEVLVR